MTTLLDPLSPFDVTWPEIYYQPMANKRLAQNTIPNNPQTIEDAVKHVVHDYTILLWSRAAIEDNRWPDAVRSHIALVYFLPRRAFADFFGTERWPSAPEGGPSISFH